MKLFRHIALAAALASASASALADKVVTYAVDPGHTMVTFSWSHFGFSTPSAAFKDITGTIVGNHDNPEQSTVSVSFPLASLDTFVPALNDHLLKSGDWFKAKQYPTVTFKSTGMSDVNRAAGTFKLNGDLTLNGVTRPVVLDARVNKVGEHPFLGNAPAAGFNATTTLKRSDFGVGNYAPAVGDELDVKITVEAIEAEAFKAAMAKHQQEAKAKEKAAKGKAKPAKAQKKGE
jgi:polyisoprenoid-binding protein YceI